MKRMTKKWLLMLVLWFAACGASPEDLERSSATLDTDIDNARADAPGNWRVKAEGLTMWVDTTLSPDSDGDRTFWVLRGRVSKTLTGLRAYTSAGYHFRGKMVSARKFEVVFSAAELTQVLAGERLYLDFFAPTGSEPLYHGMVRFAARFSGWAGSSSIYVFRAVNPVLVGDNLVFRGRAATRAGFDLDVVYTDDDADPMLTEHVTDPGNYHFDWTPAALQLAADPPTDPVYFRGVDAAGTPVEKTANIELRLVQIGLGTERPFVAWPPQRCEAEVEACLEQLESPDTETCGWAKQVEPCLDDAIELPLGADPARFAADLRETIRAWYAEHEADVREMNGRALDAALSAISTDAVGEVLDPDEIDALGYPAEHVRVFFHVDPVLRDSARVWYGVYDHAGTLLSMEVVNGPAD